MEKINSLLGDKKKFTIQHRILNGVILLGVLLASIAGVLNYFIEFSIEYTIFSGISTLVFLSSYIYSIQSQNHRVTFLIGYGYIALFYLPGLWIFNGGASAGIQYFYFLFLVVIIVTSFNRKDKRYLAFLILISAITLIIYEYLHPEKITYYNDSLARTIDLLISIVLVSVSIYFALDLFMNIYKKAIQEKEQQNILLIKKNRQIIEQQNELRILNAEKSKLFNIIAHDLKSPFNGILGLSQILTESIDKMDKKEIKELSGNIHIASTNAFNLTKSLLDWAMIQQGKITFNPSNANFCALVEETLESINDRALQKNIVVENKILEDLFLDFDWEMMKTVLRNLISNAIKFTNNGGKITVSCTKTNDNVTVSVSDNGIGMSDKIKEQIFKTGESVSVTGTAGENGTGFGLLICKEFTEYHKGKIRVESKEGIGSTFFVSLPF